MHPSRAGGGTHVNDNELPQKKCVYGGVLASLTL